jgi:exodeoxyribonuclease I
MAESTFLFYDLETSGLSKTFDQVVEFAAIRTSLDFVELERKHIYVKLTKDTVPSPEAFLIHQIGLEKLASGVSEHDAINQIHTMLNKPGTISLGYNTLGFDDEFLRFSFARCLLPPYTHQYLNSCSRMDLYPLVILYFLYKKDVMTWPEINGRCSMKLEHIASSNNWLTGQAHHAMTDVEATLSLAKALAKDANMWQFALGYFNKNTDLERMRTYCNTVLAKIIPQAYQALLVYGKFGNANNFIVPAVCLGVHKHYTNQVIWLRLDKVELQDAEAKPLDLMRFIVRKKLAEAPIVLPWKNKYLSKVSEKNYKLANNNLEFLEANPELCKQLREAALVEQYPEVTGVDLDANLYQIPFPTRQIQFLCNDFIKSLQQAEDSSLLEAFTTNKIMQQKAVRYMWRFYPDCLPAAFQEDMQQYWQQITNNDTIIDFRNNARLTPAAALERALALKKQDLSPSQAEVLRQILNYLQQNFKQVVADSSS